jgi:hypothetical protein
VPTETDRIARSVTKEYTLARNGKSDNGVAAPRSKADSATQLP